MRHERDHDLRTDLEAGLGNLAGGLDNRTRLHPVDGRERDAESAAPVAQHRVPFPQGLDLGAHSGGVDGERVGESANLVIVVRQDRRNERVLYV